MAEPGLRPEVHRITGSTSVEFIPSEIEAAQLLGAVTFRALDVTNPEVAAQSAVELYPDVEDVQSRQARRAGEHLFDAFERFGRVPFILQREDGQRHFDDFDGLANLLVERARSEGTFQGRIPPNQHQRLRWLPWLVHPDYWKPPRPYKGVKY